MNKTRSSGISAVVGIVILILLVLVLSAGVLFAAQTLVGDQPQQMVGGITEERVSPYEQRVSLVSQGNADDLTIVSPLGTEYNLSQVGDSQLYLAVSSSVSGAQDPQILGVKNGERQVLTSSEIRDGIPADIIVDKHGTGSYASIQNALNNAQPGDIVVVEKATYNENINVPPSVTLIAEHGTVIQDQNPAEPVVYIENGNATVMNFIIDADPIPGDNHYASHGILVKGNNTEIIGNTIRNATSPAGDSAGLRVGGDGVVARYNNFKNNEFSLSVSNNVGSVQLCSNQLDGGLHGSFSKSTYETFVMRNYWNKGIPSTVLNNVLSDRPNVTATDVSRNAVNFNRIFETSNNRDILASKSFPGTRLFGGAPCGIKLSFTNQGSSVNLVNASISYEIKDVTYNVTFNEDNTATLVRGNNSTTTSYSVSGGDTSWDTGETLSLTSPDSGSSGSSDTSGVWSSGSGGSGGSSFWGGGTGGGLSGGSLFGSGGGASFWGISSGTTSSDVKVTKSPTNTTASVEQTPPENVTETEKENVTVDLGADFKATVGDEIGLDAIVTGGTTPYNYTWTLGDETTSYSKSVTHIYDSTGNYTISLNVTDADGQSDTDSITVWIQESTTTTKTKNESLTLNEQVNNLSPGENLVVPSGSYSSVNVDVPGVTLVGDGGVTINGLSILSDNVKVKNVGVTGSLSVIGSDYSMYDSTINNTGGSWAIEVYETGAYFDGVTGEANNGMYVAKALQDIQFTSGSLTANSGQGILVKKHTGIVEVTDSSITATGAGIYREHGSQLYLARNSISGSPEIERLLNKAPQPAFTYNDAPLDSGSYGVKFDPSSTTDPEGEPITSMKWDFNNDGTWDAYGDGVKNYTYPDSGTYTVTLSVTDYHGVTVNLERKITINKYYFAVSTNKSTINASETVEFNATTSVPDSNIDHYNMDYDGDGTAEEQVNSLPVTHTYTTGGNYSPQIELVTTNSGTLLNSTSIQVLAPPTAAFTINTSNTNPGEDVRFNASESTDPDGGPLSYEWQFGDGTTSTGRSLTHSYSNTGDYTVTLTVTDDEGETNTTTRTISVTDSVSGPTDGLIARYEFNGNVEDTVSGIDGTNYGGTFASSPIDGELLKFNGTSSYVDIGDNSSFDRGTSTFMVTLWFKTNQTGDGVFVHKTGGGGNPPHHRNGYWISMNWGAGSTGNIEVGVRDHPNRNEIYTSNKYNDGKWHLLAAQVGPDASDLKIYIDGEDVPENVAASQGHSSTSTSHPFQIGAQATYNDGYFNGTMDDVRVYNRALSQSEVQSIFEGHNLPPTASFTYSPSSPTTGDSITFDASTSSKAGGSIASYEWDFNGDGVTDATGQTTSHTYSTTGNYTVNLTVTDDTGEKTSSAQTITVQSPLQSGLTSHWTMDNSDVSGGTLIDIAGSHNGTISGSPQTGVAGISGEALRFDGNDDYVTVSNYPFTLSNSSITFWAKPDFSSSDTSHYAVIDQKVDGDNNWGVWFNSGNLALRTSNSGLKTITSSWSSNTWYFVSISVDGNHDVTAFVNENKYSLTTDSHSGAADLGIGYQPGNPSGSSFDGEIDEVRIYDRALSDSEAQSLYEKGNIPPTAAFMYSPSPPTTNDTVSFDASNSSDTDGSISSYEWDFNNSGTIDATGQTVTHSYNSSGDKTVTLTVTDNEGTPTTISKTVTVNELTSTGTQVSNGLVAEWDFEDSSTSTVVYDQSGSHDGTVQGDAHYVSNGAAGSAMTFDGSGDYVALDVSNKIPDNDDPYAFSLWFKSSGDCKCGMIGYGDWGSSNRVNALRTATFGGSNDISIRHYWWGNDLDVETSNIQYGDNWHHIVAQYDGTTREIWIDGNNLKSDTPPDRNAQLINFAIGVTNSNEYWNGELDEVRIYNRTLTDSEIQKLSDPSNYST